MAGGGGSDLIQTPTWAVASVCGVVVLVSILIEHAIHSLGKWFQNRHKKAMIEALEKIKAELMILGFISLIITALTPFISQICIPSHLGKKMLPCKDEKIKPNDENNHRRKLLAFAQDQISRRALAAAATETDHCSSKHGFIPLISQTGLHQLHIFIFVLAVFHVLYCVVTMALSRAKMKRWQSWESETLSPEYQFNNDPSRFRFIHQTSFVRRHSGFSSTPGIKWIVAFLRQFFGSISKVDYMTMRNGFINAHFGPDSKFNFNKYIKRSMEDDFKVVVGISIPLWGFALISLLLNVYKWYALTWLSILPLFILVTVGTKLELIIMEMAKEIQDRCTVVNGAPVVEPNNKYFWFNRPQWILYIIQFTLFQNAFQVAYFFWVSAEYGFNSCFHENLLAVLPRVILGVVVQIFCSYNIFPLYALVTQMGSHMKKAIFEEQTSKALDKWRKAAKERSKLRKGKGEDKDFPQSVETTPSPGASPVHLLQKYVYRSTQTDLESAISGTSDTNFSNTDSSSHGQVQHESRMETYSTQNTIEEARNSDFTFVKPPI